MQKPSSHPGCACTTAHWLKQPFRLQTHPVGISLQILILPLKPKKADKAARCRCDLLGRDHSQRKHIVETHHIPAKEMINTFPNEGAVLLDIEPVPGHLITALSLKSAPQAKEYS